MWLKTIALKEVIGVKKATELFCLNIYAKIGIIEGERY